MKTLKKILIIIGVLILLLLILAIFMPKSASVSKTMDMDAPRNVVFNIVNELTTWDSWSPWLEEDPDIVTHMGDISSGIGANYSWESPKMGDGKLSFTNVVLNEHIDVALEMEGQDSGDGFFTFQEVNDKTKVTWSYNIKMGYPTNLMAPIMNWGMSSRMKSGLKGIEKLAKQRLEKNIYRGFEIKESQAEERHYLINRAEVQFANMQQFYAQNLGALFQKVQAAKVETAGMPSGLFFKYDTSRGVTDMAAAIPTDEAINIKDAASITIPAGKILTIDFYGDYSGLKSAHTAMEEYMRDRSILNNPPVIEEYKTDPSTETDPNKWLTRISYNIAE